MRPISIGDIVSINETFTRMGLWKHYSVREGDVGLVVGKYNHDVFKVYFARTSTFDVLQEDYVNIMVY